MSSQKIKNLFLHVTSSSCNRSLITYFRLDEEKFPKHKATYLECLFSKIIPPLSISATTVALTICRFLFVPSGVRPYQSMKLNSQ